MTTENVREQENKRVMNEVLTFATRSQQLQMLSKAKKIAVVFITDQNKIYFLDDQTNFLFPDPEALPQAIFQLCKSSIDYWQEKIISLKNELK